MISLAIVILTGCATTEYVPVPVKAQSEIIPPEPIHYIDIDFKTYAGMQCLTMEDYKNLGENMLEVKRYIQQNSIIIREYNKNLSKENEDE